MKMKVSRLFAVTRFTPKRIVRSSLPCRDGVGEQSFLGGGQLPPLPESTEAGFSF